MLLDRDSSFPSSTLISKIPSNIELTALVKELGDARLEVRVKIPVASNSFRSKESSPTNFKTAPSPKSTKSCVRESTTMRIDLLLEEVAVVVDCEDKLENVDELFLFSSSSLFSKLC